jgi:LPXTG-motif cell wall-anchored protein
LEFTKTDISTSEILPNTLIEIYNADTDELIFSGRTDSDGKIIITDLFSGRFYLLEKDAPEGYKLNEEKMYFEITEDGQVVKCTMTDEAFEVPNTGLSNIDFNLIGSMILIISGLGLTLYGIKKRK